jgi:hypothetical protein
MAAVLREIQIRRGSWVVRKPRQALMAAVIAIAVRGKIIPEETGLQLVEKQVEQGASMQQDARARDIWFDRHFFDQFDRYLQALDSEVNTEGSGGNGGDGGGGDGGGADD